MAFILSMVGKKAIRKQRAYGPKTDIAVAARPTLHSKRQKETGVEITASTGSLEPRTPLLDILSSRISNVRSRGLNLISEVEEQSG